MSVRADYLMVRPVMHDASFTHREGDILKWLKTFAWQADTFEFLEVMLRQSLAVTVYKWGQTDQYRFIGSTDQLARLTLFLVECQLSLDMKPTSESANRAWARLGNSGVWRPLPLKQSCNSSARRRAALLAALQLPYENGVTKTGEGWRRLRELLGKDADIMLELL